MSTDKITVTNELLDQWATDPSGPVALHLKQKLLPVEGEGGVIFPPTYANIGYNIDTLSDGTKVATIDSVGSQANRMEPIFKQQDYANLVPQVEVNYGSGKISIFEVGHRLGDALIRSSSLQKEAQEAFKELLASGNAQPIAELAPTSLIFGVWDSRDTQAKIPRLVQSVIRAWGVDELTRSAQYNPALDYSSLDVFTAEDKAAAEENSKNPLAQRGFVHVPSGKAHGGIISTRIEQDITINLIALRRLQAGDAENTKKLQRYLLGLSLVAATAPLDGFLRQGCLLVPDEAPAKWKIVGRDGKRAEVELTHDLAKAYANTTIGEKAFVIGESRSGDKAVTFKKEDAQKDAAEGNKKAAAKKAAKKTSKKDDGGTANEGASVESTPDGE